MLIVLAVGMAAPAQGQGITIQWEPPIRLSDPGQMAWFPDVATSDDGIVVVVWSGGARRDREAFDALILTKRQGDSWSKPVDVQAALIVQGMSYATRNSILIDRYGDLLATFRVPITLFFSRAPLAQATSARAWTAPRVLVDRMSLTTMKFGKIPPVASILSGRRSWPKPPAKVVRRSITAFPMMEGKRGRPRGISPDLLIRIP